jgi:hypothetical protein
MDRPSEETLARMPLAEAVLLLWKWVTCEERMAEVWQRHRGRCYEKLISFSLMIELISAALLQHKGSARRSFEKGIERKSLTATLQAAYKKLGRLPIEVSQAFLAEGTAAMLEAFPASAQWEPPKSLRGLRVVILDGKAIKRVAKRLKPLRGISSGLLGGRALVAMDWNTELAVAMHAHEDGEVNDVRFVHELVPVVRERVPGPRLWLADSAFCDLVQPACFTSEEGDHFLVRYHPKVKFHRDTATKQRRGKTDSGQIYVEEWGWIGSERDKRRRYVRMIRLICPGKKRDVVLVTDLLDADSYPAEDLLWLYSERWGIENMFQKVTEVFSLQRLIGSSPKAGIFQFAFCLLLYNMIQVVRGYIAQGQDLRPDEISTEKLFDDVERQLIAWNIMFEPQITLDYFWTLPDLNELQLRLQELLGSQWSDTWLKSPAQANHGKTKRRRDRTHNSVYRILHGHTRPKRKRNARSP